MRENLIKALAEYFGCEFSEVIEEGNNYFEVNGDEYLVLTDEEADEEVKNYIKESLWAFIPEFLSANTGMSKKVFEKLYGMCGEGNEAILAIVEGTCGLDKLIKEAILADGRGSFLATYDGIEHEIYVKEDGNYYYAYRI